MYEENDNVQESEYFTVTENPTVDKVLYGDDWVKGYKNGEVVLEFSKVVDRKAIILLSDKGQIVEHQKASTE